MLYHYTDFNALDGIIRCAELRLNNILNMNDSSEMRLFMNGLRQAVNDSLVQAGNTKGAAQITDFFHKEMKAEFHYSAYAACFSEYRDDAAQWERYAKGGQGVCIAFHRSKLSELTGGAVSLQKVSYQENMANNELVSRFCDLVSSGRAFDGDLEALQNLMNEAWIHSAAYKHPSFASENEVRMVYTPFIADENSVAPRYHVAWDRIKKYYPLDLRQMLERNGLSMGDLVDEIMIGPASPQSLPILQDYLYDNGHELLAKKVSLSRCPLRKPTT